MNCFYYFSYAAEKKNEIILSTSPKKEKKMEKYTNGKTKFRLKVNSNKQIKIMQINWQNRKTNPRKKGNNNKTRNKLEIVGKKDSLPFFGWFYVEY